MKTIGEWLARRESDHEEAWKNLTVLLWELGPGVASRTGAPLRLVREDATQEALAGLLADDAPLRRADQNVRLRSFLWGYLKNVTNRLLAAVPRRAALPAGTATRIAAPGNGVLPLNVLTTPQRDAVIGLREGKNLAELARCLGISRTAVRERLARAWSRIQSYRREAESVVERERRLRRADWVLTALRASLERGNLENVDILLFFGTGASHREIGSRRGFTREAVRCRLRRMRVRQEQSERRAPKAPPPRHFRDYR